MARTFDMGWEASLTALLRSPLLSRATQHKRSTSSTSTSTSSSSSSSDAPHTPPEEAVGAINQGKELDEIKAVILCTTSSSLRDASNRVAHPKSLLARIARINTTDGQRPAAENLESTSTQASSNESKIRIHRGSMLARMGRGSNQPQDEDKEGRWSIPSATTTAAAKQSAPFLPNGRAIMPGYFNNSTIRLCQFLALVIFTAFNGRDSASEFLDSDECGSLTAFIWRTNNSLTAQRYWVGGLKNSAVFRSIVYLFRLFPSNIPATSVDTMKHAFAFVSLLGVKYNTDDKVLCTIVCRGLGTPNFAVLERLALQVVDYDMLVHNGDWADCSGQLRECMRVLTSKESLDAVGGWLDAMEVCPGPRTALKRSACAANMEKARILLKALDAPEMAKSSLAMEEGQVSVPGRQAAEKRVLEWVKGVDGVIPHTSRIYEVPWMKRRQPWEPPSWPPASAKNQSIWVPAVAPSRAYAYPYA